MTIQNGITVTSSQLEVIKSIEGFVGEHLDSLLLKVEESWQPSDFLPDTNGENWIEQLTDFRTRAAALPDERFSFICRAAVV